MSLSTPEEAETYFNTMLDRTIRTDEATRARVARTAVDRTLCIAWYEPAPGGQQFLKQILGPKYRRTQQYGVATLTSRETELVLPHFNDSEMSGWVRRGTPVVRVFIMAGGSAFLLEGDRSLESWRRIKTAMDDPQKDRASLERMPSEDREHMTSLDAIFKPWN